MEIASYFEEFAERDWDPVSGADPLRYAVVGCGWFAEEFALPSIERGDLCETNVIVSGDPEKADRVAAEYDADRAIGYDEFHDGTATDAYDAVYVCTPNATHLEHVEAAADLGKDVLCEKPLERDTDRTERLIGACADAGVTLMTAYRQQAEPAIRRLRTLIGDGLIGEPVYAIGDFSITLLGRDADTDQWRLDPEMAGGGALVDLGIYPLNTLRFLIDQDPVAVAAEIKTSDERYAGIEEHISFQLSFPGRTNAAFTSSYGAVLDDQLTIVGTEGKVEIDSAFFPEVERTFHVERDEMTLSLSGGDVSGIDEEFEYFANCVLRGEQPDPDGQDGLVDTRAMDAIYEAAETGRRVEL
jgi:xylose dehydrogenase (NAD/NADP)